MKWTKEYRAAYMREYREKHREWLRVTYAIWYKANRKARNARRRKAHAALAPGRRQANGLHRSSRPDVPSARRSHKDKEI